MYLSYVCGTCCCRCYRDVPELSCAHSCRVVVVVVAATHNLCFFRDRSMRHLIAFDFSIYDTMRALCSDRAQWFSNPKSSKTSLTKIYLDHLMMMCSDSLTVDGFNDHRYATHRYISIKSDNGDFW